jgi:uncharacterized protein (TIGR02466 family)
VIESLFHTLIYHKQLITRRARLFRDLADECQQIRDFDEEGQEWSRSHYPGGFTSYASRNDLFYMSSTFRTLEEKIRPCAYEYAEALGYDLSGVSLTISDMWVNIMGPGAVHTGHIHPLSFISGTYYVSLPKGASGIQFEDPRLGFFMGAPPRREGIDRYLQPFVQHAPSPGGLVLFESWLRHEVPPHTAEEERVSVSFNYHWEYGADDRESDGADLEIA